MAVDSYARNLAAAALQNGGGEGGTKDYNQLQNKPKINNVELNGSKTADDLGLVSKQALDTELAARLATDLSNIDDAGAERIKDIAGDVIVLPYYQEAGDDETRFIIKKEDISPLLQEICMSKSTHIALQCVYENGNKTTQYEDAHVELSYNPDSPEWGWMSIEYVSPYYGVEESGCVNFLSFVWDFSFNSETWTVDDDIDAIVTRADILTDKGVAVVNLGTADLSDVDSYRYSYDFGQAILNITNRGDKKGKIIVYGNRVAEFYVSKIGTTGGNPRFIFYGIISYAQMTMDSVYDRYIMFDAVIREDSKQILSISKTYSKDIYLNKIVTFDNNDAYTPVNDYNPATKKYVDDTVAGSAVDLTNYLNKKDTGINELAGKIQIGSKDTNITNAILHIRNVGANSITGKSVNGACYSVNADGTASLQHKTYNNDGTGAKNAAVLRMSNKGIQFAVNSGTGAMPSEADYKELATQEYVDNKIKELINKYHSE